MCDFVAALLGNDLPQCTVILNEGAKENNLFFDPNMDWTEYFVCHLAHNVNAISILLIDLFF